MENFATIRVRETKELKSVKVSSLLKPEIQSSILQKWQSLIDTAAKLAQVPSALIMRLNTESIEVFLKSNTNGNPYKNGEKEELIHGLYCETVIGNQDKLLVPDATRSEVWRDNNPDVDINMISYLGFPINWPDGEVFGTVCFLDNKENHYNKDYMDLLKQVKQHLENDLEILLLNNSLEEKNRQLEQANITKSKFLSLISHDIRGSIGTVNEFIKLITNNLDYYDKNQLKIILSSLSQNASSTHETLESLLRWSKNDILQLEPEIKNVDIISVLDKLLLYFEHSINMKGINITKSYCSQKTIVNTDENMITVIFRNIISNAIKYNHRNGDIALSVKDSEGKYTVTIEDNGTGIKQETLDKLFEYNKEHEKGTEGESSAGIGLIMTKEFIDKLGASITVNSTQGEGSVFSIKLNN
ncbi:MAG: GAF domain-containing sensor histidine kinase [Bacteroidales bacterium]|nr:GAF domain-containing sensor histidine kinase [Bacteroidales bacterium]